MTQLRGGEDPPQRARLQFIRSDRAASEDCLGLAPLLAERSRVG